MGEPARRTSRWNAAQFRRRSTAARAETSLEELSRVLTEHRVERSKANTAIREETLASIKPGDRLGEGELHGLELLALDVWCGRDFSLRNRARAWGWVPFYDGELDTTPDTTESVVARLNRSYRLNGKERAEHKDMADDPTGRFAVTAALLAARINAYSVWRHTFFDEHSVRVDLASELEALTERARKLHCHQKVLGPQPHAELRSDPDVDTLYISKATAIDRGIGALVERVAALDSYCDVVAGIQRLKNKYDYLSRLQRIDDFELLIDDDLDRRESQRVRDAGTLSDALAAVYLDTLTPLTATLSAPQRSEPAAFDGPGR